MKGASVFQILAGKAHRPTKDIDFLGFGTNNPQQLKDRLFNQNWTPRQEWQLLPEFKFSEYQGEMEKIYPLPKSTKEQSTNQSQSKQELD